MTLSAGWYSNHFRPAWLHRAQPASIPGAARVDPGPGANGALVNSKSLQAANPSYLVSYARHLASVIGATATQHPSDTTPAITTPARALRRAPWPTVSGWTVAHYNV